MNQKISVIIPAYNSAATIEACLTSILNQTQPPEEIIVVDDGSTDGTVAKITHLQQELPKIRLFKESHQGPGASRNFASAKAVGDILVFVDSDMEFDQNFLKELTRPIMKSRAIGTWSGNEWVKNWSNVWARCWNYNANRPTRRMIGANPGQKPVFRAVLKSEFMRIKGFDLIGYTDDWTLGNKLGVMPKTSYAKFYHHNPATLAAVFSHARWVGKRPYKFGAFGTLLTVFRSNFLFSLLIGLYKSLRYLTSGFVVFKLVYDFGITWGALENLCFGFSY